MARLHFIKKARKDYPNHGIKKGDSYYWWRLWKRSKQMSTKRPPRSALTGSAYLGTLYDIQDGVAASFDGLTPDDCQDAIEEIKGQLEELEGDQQESLDNMPEGLQEGDTGQLLQERIGMLEEAVSELEGIDTETATDGIDEIIDQVNDALGNIS